ncbi:hypothetical protein VOLCADRAFT_98050 [Volvox carteri f. nagariensis]|uniref:Uncharacterized protein n=1 Tax=Volvox carteri f. nagariensis TaxID=3068 RepID=D8UEB3_VOLCA|nr:uncharacterized protein VOLCADRAFT_98050 [Volvox carteri f. nagariensis]EFJ41974.1 hypothetical protein VOLCADRAFT_98050 [Volvox carteri f. nagariensis]|eukprot:XP_002957011.1 hypothetical protein VOLCADRAFT_98050 [Volvox carteri f. nagariensis]
MSIGDHRLVSFIQWLYNWADVNSIIGVANALQALDKATKGNEKEMKSREQQGANQQGDEKDAEAWFKRVKDEANQLAKKALSRIPVDHTIGIDRRTFPTASGMGR